MPAGVRAHFLVYADSVAIIAGVEDAASDIRRVFRVKVSNSLQVPLLLPWIFENVRDGLVLPLGQ